ncbi:starch-binding protein [uncultured Clostridium sp.]|uniref:starch-binding protein n=1 Tax=uncultured Clostridium sp. TaxID=59620 RepID=UPI0025FCBA75|nr:starch-binding protein [uncultured Clostridium sp.]
MKNRNKIISLLTASTLALSLVFNNVTGLLTVNAASKKASVNEIDDGAILHAWNWSFDTIKSRLPEIKAAGYKAVQTSPIQANKDPYTDNSKWWILYQPINFKIGNTQLGSRDQFKSMCEEAEKYDIDIIVDVVANHTGNRGDGADAYYPHNSVDPSIKNNESFWHDHRGVDDWNNRWQVTQWGIGLPDLNTANRQLQDMIIDFLNDAIACGADGFRFDAAKHIELPSDPAGSDFWPRVLGSLDRDDLFIYGEVLQGGADNITGYHQYMATTVDWYGGSVRSAVGYHGSANVNNAKTYPISANPSNLVTWVESHDTYANDHKETVALTNEQIKLGWAIIAGRADSTPLFFNRTAGGYLAGSIGSAGDNMWKDPIVVAANNFRNAMAGENEYVRTQGNNLFITERGTSGVMIVNVGGSTNVNCDTKLPNGQYKDTVSGNTFTVSNGKLTGNIGNRTIATIILKDVVKEPTVSSSVETGTKFVDSINVTLTAQNTTKATYSIDGGAAKTYTNGQSITLGKDAKIGDIITLTLVGNDEEGKSTTATYKYEKVDKVLNATAKIKLPSGWSSANIYVYDESGSTVKELAAWPGAAMTNEGNGVYSYTLPEGWGDNTQVIFNNGNNQIPAAQEPGFVLPTGSTMIYENGTWKNAGVVVKEPVVSSSVVSGTEFINSLQVTLNAENTAKATYSINGGAAKTYTNGQSITLGSDIAVGETVKLTLVGENSEGKTVTKTYTYKKVAKPIVTTSVAKIKLPSGWSSANIYVYDESGSTVKELAAWPGAAMTNEGNGVYSYTLPEGWGDNTQVIFNNGNNQIPAAQQPGFVLPAGNIGTYADGRWTLEEEIIPTEPIEINSFTTNKTSPQIADTTITLTADANGGAGALQYKFVAKNISTGNEKVISNFSSSNSVKWTPTVAGTYEVKVIVKDSEDATEYKTIEFVVSERVSDITLSQIKIDKDSCVVSEEVVLSAEATGGIGNLSYKFYYEKDSEYVVIKEYSSENSVVWTPTEAGTYSVRVEVRDSAGNVRMSGKNFVVESKLKVSGVTLSKEDIKVGETVDITTIALGANNIKYRVAVHDFENTWTTLHDFETSNITSWTPEIADTYVIWVDVIDEDGNYLSESIEVKVTE